MAKRVTTLYIGDTDISLLSMKGMQIEKWASTPLEPGLVSQGLVTDEAAVAEKVTQLFKDAGVAPKKIITALIGHDSLYRIITLPDVPEAVLPEAVRREARRTIPTPLDEVYYSYQSIASMPGERRVFLVTYPRNSVDALVRTLRQAGVAPYVMDLAPLAIGRIPDVPRAIIVNFRVDHLEVMIIAGRLPEVIRRLSLPGESESLEEKLSLVAEEFSRTVMFYNSSHIEKPLDSTVPVFVSGDLADAPETWQELVGDSGYQVSPLPPPLEVPEGFNANQFMINIGLALKEIRPDKGDSHFSLVNFNALPEAYIPPSFSILRVLIPVGVAVGIGLVVLAVFLNMNARAGVDDLRPQVATAEARVRQLQTEVTSLRSDINSIQARRDTLSNRIAALQEARAKIHEDLREITRLANASPKVTVKSISHSGGSVKLSGTSTDEEGVYLYARALRASGRFSGVWIPSISGSAGSFSFSLDISK